MCMYLAMRVTATIWTAIVLHGLTDPATFLSTGGVDEAVRSIVAIVTRPWTRRARSVSRVTSASAWSWVRATYSAS